MEAYRFNTKHNAELFQYAVLSHRLNRGKYRAKLEGFTVTTNAPEDIIDSAYKDLGAYGRDPHRVRKTARQGVKKRAPVSKKYQVCQRDRVLNNGLTYAQAITLARKTALKTKRPARVETVYRFPRSKRVRYDFVAAFGYDGKRLKTVNAFGKKMPSRRDVSRADLKHLSGAALLKLLRQAVKSGDEDKAEMIGKELDRRGKGF